MGYGLTKEVVMYNYGGRICNEVQTKDRALVI